MAICLFGWCLFVSSDLCHNCHQLYGGKIGVEAGRNLVYQKKFGPNLTFIYGKDDLFSEIIYSRCMKKPESLHKNQNF